MKDRSKIKLQCKVVKTMGEWMNSNGKAEVLTDTRTGGLKDGRTDRHINSGRGVSEGFPETATQIWI